MKNNRKKLLSLLLAVLMVASLTVTALAAGEGTTGNFDGTTMSEEVTLTYTVTHEADYTDLSGVKLSWSVPIVKYTKDTATVWNTTTLKWEQKVTETVGEGTNTATFTIVNRSSKAVVANATFALEDSLKKDAENAEDKDAASVVFDKKDVELNTVVGTDTDRTVDSNAKTMLNTDAANGGCMTTITATVSLTDASKLSSGTSKLGTYTVSISKPTT